MGALAAGVMVIAVITFLVARRRRRASARKRIEVGTVSDGWVAQHRGDSQD